MAHDEKFTDEQRRQIVLWFALGDGLPLVMSRIRDQWGITCAGPALWGNYSYRSKTCSRHWKVFGLRVRRLAIKRFAEIPIAQKSNRLRLLHEAAQTCLQWSTKSVSEAGEVQEQKIDTLVRVLEAARKEMEGERPNINIDQSRHLHVTSIMQFMQSATTKATALTTPTPALVPVLPTGGDGNGRH